MSWDRNNSISTLQLQKDVVAGATVPREGVLLMAVVSGGVEKVQPTAGAGTDLPCGFAVSDTSSDTDAPKVESITVPAAPGPYTVNLEKTGQLGTGATKEISVIEGTTAYTQVATVGAIGGTGDFHLDNTVDPAVLTFHSADAGKSLTTYYRYALSALEAKLLYYERSVNNTAGATLGTVSMMTGYGEFHTYEYDNAVNWLASNPTILTGADGKLTIGGAGAAVPAVVSKQPNTTNAALGVRFNFTVV